MPPIPSTTAAPAPTTSSPAAAPAQQTSGGPGGPGGPLAVGRYLMGALLLLVAAVSSGILAWNEIARVTIPGCGPGSACGELAKSAWGKVPFVDWPVSFLGLAYFASLFIAWIAIRGREGTALRWLIRLGALASLVFMGVMVSKQLICPYCLAAHIANLLFVIMVEITGRGIAKSTRAGIAPRLPLQHGLSALLIVFFGGTLAIAVAQQQVAKSAAREQEAQLAASTAELLRAQQANQNRTTPAQPAANQTTPPVAPPETAAAPEPEPPAVVTKDPEPPAAQPQQTPAQTQPPATTQQPATTPPATQPRNTPAVTVQSTSAGAVVEPGSTFTGRHRFGPEKAAVRIVMFTGYQCTDCKSVDTQIKQILARWPGKISYSPKHFPMSSKCNKHMPMDMHANACWAARAAEAAGILYGFEGFARMHNWLYEVGGSFTDQSFPPALQQLGFDPNTLQQTMMGPETLRRVEADIEEAMRYGIMQTPMVFINGVEMKGWNAPNALMRAVETLMATDPPAQTAEFDRPPNAGDKAVADWREAREMAWASRTQPWAAGPESAPVKIHMWGDFQEPNTAQADQIIRSAMVGRNDIRYEFRYFPVDQSCNPSLPRNIYPLGCRAARAAEAAGIMGGASAYWRMHEWLFENQQRFSDENLRNFAQSIGLLPDGLLAAMNTPQVDQAIQGDISIAQRLAVPSIPRIYINGKLVARWNLENEFIIERIIEEAAVPAPDPNPDPSLLPQLPGMPPR